MNHLNDTVWCKLGASPTHGVGVIAIKDISKGTLLTDYTYANLNDPKKVYNLNEVEFKQILPVIRNLILDRMLMGKKFVFISPNADQNLRSFMNHSDDPNSDGVRALKDIKEGEEVTENYKDFTTEVHTASKKHWSFIEWTE